MKIVLNCKLMSIATNLVLRLCILMMTVIIPEYSIISVHLEPPIKKSMKSYPGSQ